MEQQDIIIKNFVGKILVTLLSKVLITRLNHLWLKWLPEPEIVIILKPERLTELGDLLLVGFHLATCSINSLPLLLNVEPDNNHLQSTSA